MVNPILVSDVKLEAQVNDLMNNSESSKEGTSKDYEDTAYELQKFPTQKEAARLLVLESIENSVTNTKTQKLSDTKDENKLPKVDDANKSAFDKPLEPADEIMEVGPANAAEEYNCFNGRIFP